MTGLNLLVATNIRPLINIVMNAQALPSEEDHHPPPFKRRKVFRRRPRSEDEEEDDSAIASLPTATIPEATTLDELISKNGRDGDADVVTEGEAPLSMAEILRQRKAMQRRRGGVAFRNDNTASNDEMSVVKAKPPPPAGDETLNKIMGVVDRFAPQTGLVENVDEHMYDLLLCLLLQAQLQMLTSEGWRI